MINGTDFLVVVFAVLPVILLSHHVAHPSRQTTKSGWTFALYFPGHIIVYSIQRWIIPDKKPRPVFLFTSTRCFHQIALAQASLPPLSLPHFPHSCLDVVVVAAPQVNCCVAAALAIVNLGCRCLDLIFQPFGWRPWYNGGRHGPWAMVLVFSQIVLFDSTWPEQSYQFLCVMGSHFYP